MFNLWLSSSKLMWLSAEWMNMIMRTPRKRALDQACLTTRIMSRMSHEKFLLVYSAHAPHSLCANASVYLQWPKFCSNSLITPPGQLRQVSCHGSNQCPWYPQLIMRDGAYNVSMATLEDQVFTMPTSWWKLRSAICMRMEKRLFWNKKTFKYSLSKLSPRPHFPLIIKISECA